MGSLVSEKKLTAWFLAGGYAVLIGSMLFFAAWAYFRHREVPEVEPETPSDEERPPLVIATWDRRFTFVDEAEFFAPAAFPWSVSSIGEPPRAEVLYVTGVSGPSPGEVGEEAPAGAGAPAVPSVVAEGGYGLGSSEAGGYEGLIRKAVLERAPGLAMPYELNASPPYLVVPVEFELDFKLGPDGSVKSVAVTGVLEEGLKLHISEKAAGTRFPDVLSWFDFKCGVRLTPAHYERISATRRGAPLAASEYRVLLRVLQSGSRGFAETVAKRAPALLSAENNYTLEFTIGADGYPRDTTIRPLIVEPAAEEAVVSAMERINFPVPLAGTKVVLKLG